MHALLELRNFSIALNGQVDVEVVDVLFSILVPGLPFTFMNCNILSHAKGAIVCGNEWDWWKCIHLYIRSRRQQV